MVDFWNSDPAYQAYKAARWRRELVRAGEIVTEGLASSDPMLRAHWLVAKASLWADMPNMPDRMGVARESLETALATGPAEHDFRRVVFQVALGIAVNEGPALQMLDIVKRSQSRFRELASDPGIAYNMGVLRFYGGQWRQSLFWLERSFAGGFSSGGGAGQAVRLSVRARVYARLGRSDEAERDLQEGCRLFEQHGQGVPRHPGLSIAQAEIALMRREMQTVRDILQTHFVTSVDAGFPAHRVHVSMVVAELALAEGNPEGYRHYSDLALTTCREHGLSISIHYVQAVAAQVEQKYGLPGHLRPAPRNETQPGGCFWREERH